MSNFETEARGLAARRRGDRTGRSNFFARGGIGPDLSGHRWKLRRALRTRRLDEASVVYHDARSESSLCLVARAWAGRARRGKEARRWSIYCGGELDAGNACR